MNKKILFYYSKLGLGGAERSLTRFMNALSKDGNEVTLLTRYGGGSGIGDLDNKIRVMSFSSSSDFTKKRGIPHIFGRVRSELEKLFFERFCLIKREHFDLMVLGSHGKSPYPMLRIFDIDKCIKCIRNDLKSCAGHESGIKVIRKYRDKIDGYLCVSGTVKESLDSAVPEEAEKSFVLYNFLEPDKIREKINQSENPYEDDGMLHIVSVCRVSNVSKGIFRMIDVCERLVNNGLKFKWYLVGDGEDLAEAKNRINEKKIGDYFISVGKKDNPFGFYKYSDLVAVLSYYEGLCGIVNEAKIAGAAVIATEFSGIHEQLDNGVSGWIVENSEEAIYEKMKELIEKPELITQVKNQIYPEEILNDELKLEKFYSVLGWK